MESFLWLSDLSQPKYFWFRLIYVKTRTVWKLSQLIKEPINRPNFFIKNSLSSAHWFIFIELFALLKISTPITHKVPESEQPCLTPLVKMFGDKAIVQNEKTWYIILQPCDPLSKLKVKSFKAYLKVAPSNSWFSRDVRKN